MLPEEATNPDVLINGYSTNDMHIISLREAEGRNMTVEENTLDVLQQFARLVLRRNELSAKCTQKDIPPMLYLHLNDYIGNEQREILKTSTLTKVNAILAPYYGYASMSYADVVRDYVYGDTRETFFSPLQWYKRGGAMTRDGKRRKCQLKYCIFCGRLTVLRIYNLKRSPPRCTCTHRHHVGSGIQLASFGNDVL